MPSAAGVCVQPVVVQVSTVQALASPQPVGGQPGGRLQVAQGQTSAVGEATPSLQVVPFGAGACVQPVVVQVSTVQALSSPQPLSGQTGVPLQAPARQTSPVV